MITVIVWHFCVHGAFGSVYLRDPLGPFLTVWQAHGHPPVIDFPSASLSRGPLAPGQARAVVQAIRDELYARARQSGFADA